jgi:hypothetical protein
MAGVFGDPLPARGAELVVCVVTELDPELELEPLLDDDVGAGLTIFCTVDWTVPVTFGTTLSTFPTAPDTGFPDPKLTSGSASRIASEAPKARTPCVATRREGVEDRLPSVACRFDPLPNDIRRLPCLAWIYGLG